MIGFVIAAPVWARRALAYYSVFSLGPLLLIVTAVAGLIWGADAVRGAMVAQFRGLLGESGSQAIEAMLRRDAHTLIYAAIKEATIPISDTTDALLT